MSQKAVLRPVFPVQDTEPPAIDPEARRGAFQRWFEAMLKSRRFSRQEFANRISDETRSIDRSTVAHWALDRTPSPDLCVRIADGLNVPVGEVLTIAGYLDHASQYDQREPIRARLHTLVDALDPEVLEPHLAILERTAGLLNLEAADE